MKKILTVFAAILVAVAWTGCIAQVKVVDFEKPKMKVFVPPGGLSNGKAVVACPGGGYQHLAVYHEGYDWAPFFNDLGFVYAVVSYTMPEGDKARPTGDVAECFRILADSAKVWKINPDSIGIMGSSAGGHLAATMSTHHELGCRPAFQILFYPVISFDGSITHRGSRDNFLGAGWTEADVEEWSADKAVGPDTPPAFITLCSDDRVVVPDNSLRYYKSLIDAGVEASMFVYPKGGHGFGYRSRFPFHDRMTAELAGWLRNLR